MFFVVGRAEFPGGVGHGLGTRLLIDCNEGAQARDGREGCAELDGVDEEHGRDGDLEGAQEVGLGVDGDDAVVEIEDLEEGVFGGCCLEQREAELVGVLDERDEGGGGMLWNFVAGEEEDAPAVH